MSINEVIALQAKNHQLRDQIAQLLNENDSLRQSLADWAGPEITDSKVVKVRVIVAGVHGQGFSDADVSLDQVTLALDPVQILAGSIKPVAYAVAQSYLQNMGVLPDPKIIHPI